jgi:hypothetical protein
VSSEGLDVSSSKCKFDEPQSGEDDELEQTQENIGSISTDPRLKRKPGNNETA